MKASQPQFVLHYSLTLDIDLRTSRLGMDDHADIALSSKHHETCLLEVFSVDYHYEVSQLYEILTFFQSVHREI